MTLEWSKPLDSGGARITGYLVRSRQWLSANESWSAPVVAYDGRSSRAQTARIQGLVANTRYGFSVIAFNYRSVCVAEELNLSGAELVITTQDGIVPFEPKNFRVANVTGGAVTLAWDAPLSSDGVPLLGYVLFAGIAVEDFFLFASIDVADPRVLTVFGLQTKEQYKFVICAENARGLGRNSTILLATTAEATPPEPPKNLQQHPSTSGGSIVLSWDAPDDTGGVTLQRYLVYRNDSLIVGLDALDQSTVFADSIGVQANQVYKYSIVVANSVWTSRTSAILLVRSSPATVPQPPSMELLATGGGFIKLAWSPSPDAGGVPVRGYSVLIKRSGTTVSSYAGDLTRMEFRALYAETEYRLSVQTKNDVGLSAPATGVAITEVASPPAQPLAPRLLAVYGGRARVEVIPPDDFGGTPVTAYHLFVDSKPTAAEFVSVNVFDIVGLFAATNYQVSLSAVNAVGEGEMSTPAQVLTTGVSTPGLVNEVVALDTSFDSLDVKWDPPSDTGGVAASSIAYDVAVVSITDSRTQTLADARSPLKIQGLEADTQYALRVCAKNSAGTGAWSVITLAKTDPVSPGTMSFLSNTTSVSEGAAMLNVTVIRTNGGAKPATCRYRLFDGTAVATVHYYGTVTGTIHFSAGTKQQTLNISVINNNVLDDPERVFFIELLAIDFESGEVGTPSILAVTIQDDGDSGLIQFSQPSYTVVESTASLRILITRIKAFSGAVVARVDTTDVLNGAVRDTDYYLLNSTVSFADQQVEAAIYVHIVNDAMFQMQKVFGLNLTITSGRAGIGTLSSALVEIVDDGDVSQPGQPQSVTAVALSGGSAQVDWIAPTNRGAANITILSYRVTVLSNLQLTREFSTFSTSLNITGIAARSVISVTVATRNGYFEGYPSVPAFAQTPAPTPPSAPQSVLVLWRTGGAANVSWLPPLDSGGAAILLYRIVVRAAANTTDVAISDTRAEHFAMYGLLPLTDYSVTVQAENHEGLYGVVAPAQYFTTRAASVPSKPPGVVVANITGGALYLNLVPPLDLGGLPVSQITLSATSREFPSVFTDVYNGTSSSFVYRRLTYSTEYKLKYKVANAVVRSCTSIVREGVA